MIGKTLAHFKITAKLGEGGMGEVYRASDTKLGREVAIKVLPQEFVADPERLARFEREAKVVAALNHPNIVTLYSVEAAPAVTGGQDVHFLTMELVQGQSLDQLVREGRLSMETFFDLAVPITDAVRAAHEQGVVHRDLKPSNIMVDKEGRVKILDFGLAKFRPQGHGAEGEPTLTLTTPGSFLGTISYMSPEQALGGDVDHRSDLFSLGVLFYELTTAQLPFRGGSSFEVLDRIVRSEPTAPSLVRPDLPSPLERIILKCLAKKPAARFQDAAELCDELAAVAQARTEAGPSRKGSILVLPFADFSPDHDNEYFSDGLTEEIIASLSKIGSLAVISRTSAMRLKGSEQDIRTLGREMNVRCVLEGSVRKAGNALRITAQLVDTMTDTHLWAHTYKGTLEDIFEIQELVAQRIAEALAIELSLEEKVVLTRRETDDAEAFDRCLRGRHLLTRDTKKALATAIELFEQAIAIDTRYAVAYAGLAEADAKFYEFYDRSEERLERATENAFKALMYDPNLPDAYAALALAQYNKGNLTDARIACERSIELDQDNYIGYWALGRLYHVTGRDREAIDALQKAMELNPDFYPAYFMFRMVTQALGEDWRYEPHLQRLLGEVFPAYLKRNPDDARAINSYGMELFMAGRAEESLIHVERALEMSPEDPLIVYATACYYSFIGRPGRALDLLERAIRAGFRNHEYIKSDPDLRNLHGEARYHEILAAEFD